jgi:hypothetical protein
MIVSPPMVTTSASSALSPNFDLDDGNGDLSARHVSRTISFFYSGSVDGSAWSFPIVWPIYYRIEYFPDVSIYQ